MWSRMPGCPVMTKFCCRWSTTPARPRPSSLCWWTSKILQFPLDQPCRCSSTLRPECFQWLSWIGVERILWVFWCWNERAHAFKFRPGNPNLYICCVLGQDSSNTLLGSYPSNVLSSIIHSQIRTVHNSFARQTLFEFDSKKVDSIPHNHIYNGIFWLGWKGWRCLPFCQLLAHWWTDIRAWRTQGWSFSPPSKATPTTCIFTYLSKI